MSFVISYNSYYHPSSVSTLFTHQGLVSHSNLAQRGSWRGFISTCGPLEQNVLAIGNCKLLHVHILHSHRLLLNVTEGIYSITTLPELSIWHNILINYEFAEKNNQLCISNICTSSSILGHLNNKCLLSSALLQQVEHRLPVPI